jgi:CheY-like chemotaxis protein
MTAPEESCRHVLIIDDDESFRDAVAGQFKRSGWSVHAAETYEDGLQVFQLNQEIGLVIIDHATVGADVGGVVHLLRAVRPNTFIVGNSGEDRRAEFAEAGVNEYLQKPWRVPDLLGTLDRRIASCVECGMPLPLRRPAPGESGSSWACAYCGSRYRAVLEQGSPPEFRSNALRVDQPPDA